jgi:hypothetical protein
MDWQTIGNILHWALISLALSPIILGIGWGIVEHDVLPRLIPRAEIQRLADEIAARHPHDPEGAAFTEEHAAWFRSHAVEQGKWRRVRKELRRRGA